MKWLGMSLVHSGYRGKSHLIWYDSGKPDAALEQAVWTGMRRGELTFLYRCSDRTMPPPPGRYWRMMSEHPSMRIYQLEGREGERGGGEAGEAGEDKSFIHLGCSNRRLGLWALMNRWRRVGGIITMVGGIRNSFTNIEILATPKVLVIQIRDRVLVSLADAFYQNAMPYNHGVRST